ncbi:E3 ubiquitin-protein ligase rnf13 [Coemansia erecta]|nr:E3 ubiquitin-protein ligase rnf13 [Coemansia sp. RSA 2618]KAJ2829221.1 E3 ubiquitin-protein ligase rnf13 [Coemansia erecta]
MLVLVVWCILIFGLAYFSWKRHKRRRALQLLQQEDAENEEGRINTKKTRPLTKAEIATLKVATLTEEDIQSSKRMAASRISAPLSAHHRSSTDSSTLASRLQRASMPAQSSSEVDLAFPEPAVIDSQAMETSAHTVATPLPHRTKSSPLLARLGRRIASRHHLRSESIEMSDLNSHIHEENCAVCLDDFAVGDKVRLLPCKHYFHVSCIDQWLTKNTAVCPLCNLNISTAFDHVEPVNEG